MGARKYKGLGYRVSTVERHRLLNEPEPSSTDQFAEWATVYLLAAEKLNENCNRFHGWWIPAYHLLHQSMELALKSVLAKQQRQIAKGQKGHDLIYLVNTNADLFVFTKDEATALVQLQHLNKDFGGLRYPDSVIEGRFLPSTFDNSVTLIYKLLS